MRATLLLFITALFAGSAATGDYASIKAKFKQIQTDKLKPGTRITLTEPELNAWVQRELPEIAPPGVRNPRVHLIGNNSATGSALIDFVKLRSAQGNPPGLLFRTLLQGEHEVQITARIRSGGGQATVDPQEVRVNGIPVSGAALDFLIQNYLLANYPDAKVSKPFRMEHRIDRIEVTPKAAYVITR